MKISLLTAFIIGAFCCCPLLGYTLEYNKNASVQVVTKNIGTKNLIDAYTKFGEYTVDCGLLYSGKRATWGYYPHPITDKAEVYFKHENGEEIKRIVDIGQNNKLLNSTELTVIIKINSDTNDVTIDTHNGLTLE
jgi:hypothetical protein